MAQNTQANNNSWRQVKTQHFTIVYNAADEASARELLSFAEDIYKLTTDYFKSYPTDLYILLNSSFENANGYFASAPAHTVLFINSPIEPDVLGINRSLWLKYLLTHELTHYIQGTTDHGALYYGSFLFGNYFKSGNSAFMPPAYIEGIAVEIETVHEASGRGNSPYYDMYMRSLILGNDLYKYDIGTFSSPYQNVPGGRHYLTGFYLIQYINKKYGADTFAKIYNKYVEWPFFGLDPAIVAVTGKWPNKLFDDMQAEYRDELTHVELGPKREQWSPNKMSSSIPVFTDTSIITGQWSEYKPFTLHSIEAKNEHDLISYSSSSLSSHNQAFSASRDGRIIVAGRASPRIDRVDSAKSDLIICRDGIWSNLTEGARLFSPALSPDGKTLVAMQLQGLRYRLVQVSLIDGKVTVLTEGEDTSYYMPQFSPDGKKIIALKLNGENLDLVEFTISSSDPNNIAEALNANLVMGKTSPNEYYPSYDKDNNIIFVSDYNPKNEKHVSLNLYRYDRNTTKVTVIAKDQVGIMAARFNLDNSELFYQSYEHYYFVLKKIAAQELLTELTSYPVTPTEVVSLTKATAPNNVAPLASQDFIDWPMYIGWVPMISATPSTGGWMYGARFISLGLLGTDLISNIAYLPIDNQVNGSVALNLPISTSTLSYNISKNYSKSTDGYYTDSVYNEVAFIAPLLNGTLVNTNYSLRTTSLLGVAYNKQNPKAFNVAEFFTLNTSYTVQSLQYTVAQNFTLSFSQAAPSAALLGGNQLRLGITGIGQKTDKPIATTAFLDNNTWAFVLSENIYAAYLLPIGASLADVSIDGVQGIKSNAMKQITPARGYRYANANSSKLSFFGQSGGASSDNVVFSKASNFAFAYRSFLSMPLPLSKVALYEWGFNDAALALGLEGFSGIDTAYEKQFTNNFFASSSLAWGLRIWSMPFYINTALSYHFYDSSRGILSPSLSNIAWQYSLGLNINY